MFSHVMILHEWLIHIYQVMSFMHIEHTHILIQEYTMNCRVEAKQHSQNLEDSSYVLDSFSRYLRSFKTLNFMMF